MTETVVDNVELAGAAPDRAVRLTGKRVAILVADGFEQSEMTRPRSALEQAGARTILISLERGEVTAWSDHDWAGKFPVDLALADARAEHFDALLLPGGVMNPDTLRAEPRAVDFVRKMNEAGKPIAAICHGPWTLIDAEAVRGRKLTSWPSLRADIENAGGEWTDCEVMMDDGLVTSRKPDDIPAFNAKMLEAFAAGPHKRTPPHVVPHVVR